MTVDLIREAREWAKALAKDDCTGEPAVVMRDLADALERAEKERDGIDAAWRRSRRRDAAEHDRLRAENEANASTASDLLAHCDRLRAENEKLRSGVRRVEYAWENLRGWMPGGRGVPNWTRELNAAIAALRVDDPDEAELRREADMPC